MNVTSKIKSQNKISCDELVAHIKSSHFNEIEENLTIRAVFYQQDDDKWIFLIGTCEIGFHKNEEQTIYDDYAFITKHYSSKSIFSLIKDIDRDGIVLNTELELTIKPVHTSPCWQWELVPSHASQSSYPTYLYSADINKNINAPDMPLIGYGQPFF